MADLAIYILLSLILLAAVVIIILLWYLHKNKQPDFEKLNQEIDRASLNMNNEIQKLFSTLQLKSSATGAFGEKIADLILSYLPSSIIESQYSPKDIRGSRIDFAVKLPNSQFLLPIDSKFTLPEDFKELDHLDSEIIKNLNKFAIKRAESIVKYIKSKETTDFVLMFIPDYVFGILNEETFDRLATMKVVPTNTSGLLSTVFMINMQNRFTTLNEEACKFNEIQIKTSQELKDIIKTMETGFKQLGDCQNNLSKSLTYLKKIKIMIDTLEIADEINNE